MQAASSSSQPSSLRPSPLKATLSPALSPMLQSATHSPLPVPSQDLDAAACAHAAGVLVSTQPAKHHGGAHGGGGRDRSKEVGIDGDTEGGGVAASAGLEQRSGSGESGDDGGSDVNGGYGNDSFEIEEDISGEQGEADDVPGRRDVSSTRPHASPSTSPHVSPRASPATFSPSSKTGIRDSKPPHGTPPGAVRGMRGVEAATVFVTTPPGRAERRILSGGSAVAKRSGKQTSSWSSDASTPEVTSSPLARPLARVCTRYAGRIVKPDP